MLLVPLKECVLSVDAVDDALRRVCLRWATAECEESETEAGGSEEESHRTAARDWSGMTGFESLLSTVRVVRSNLALHPFTADLF